MTRFALAIAAFLLFPAASFAGDLYLSASGGAMAITATDIKLSGAMSGSGHIGGHSGAIASGIVGYRFGPFVSAEAEIVYGKFNYGSLDIGGVKSKVTGDMSMFGGFGNLIFTPLGYNAFTPYVGGGLGAMNYESNVDSVQIRGIENSVHVGSSKTGLAANFIAGFDFAANERLSIGARYRAIWSDADMAWTARGVKVEQGDILSHALTVNAILRF